MENPHSLYLPSSAIFWPNRKDQAAYFLPLRLLAHIGLPAAQLEAHQGSPLGRSTPPPSHFSLPSGVHTSASPSSSTLSSTERRLPNPRNFGNLCIKCANNPGSYKVSWVLSALSFCIYTQPKGPSCYRHHIWISPENHGAAAQWRTRICPRLGPNSGGQISMAKIQKIQPTV